MSSVDPRLDRRLPSTRRHIELYPVSAIKRLARTVQTVEKKMRPPSVTKYHAIYDQGQEGACVGFGESILMSILNRKLYDALWLYREAQEIDEWHDTPPESGTSLSAAFDVLRGRGHRQIRAGVPMPELIQHGIVDVNRWLQTVDEGRTAIADGHPIVDGIAWFQAFYKPEARKRKLRNGRTVTEYWIPEPDLWGRMVGYHCICRPEASDQREAFGWLNSWGRQYPWPTYISYRSHEKLMQINGEAAIVTDR